MTVRSHPVARATISTRTRFEIDDGGANFDFRLREHREPADDFPGWPTPDGVHYHDRNSTEKHPDPAYVIVRAKDGNAGSYSIDVRGLRRPAESSGD